MNIITESTCSYTFVCSGCGIPIAGDEPPTFARCVSCGSNPILVQYPAVGKKSKSEIDTKEQSMWRYRHFLPIHDNETAITLGEGWTPVLRLEKMAHRYGFSRLYMKDESFNPTGSFKARGLSMAVTKAKSAGIQSCIIPTAGNAGGAMSAYCAKAGMEAIVVMPSHTPAIFQQECLMYGAEVILVEGLISDCARKVTTLKKEKPCFDLSTMKEPYRLEGKKTLGYEIAEQLDWALPDVILYPTGGGTGLIGIWKAFQEMKEYGWINCGLPKMIAVQAANCQPLAQTLSGRQKDASLYKGLATMANGLAVPNPFAERLILKVVQESKGTIVTVDEQAIVDNWKEMASVEGLIIAPEGAALMAALKSLEKENFLKADAKILLLNTGSGYKYLENLKF